MVSKWLYEITAITNVEIKRAMNKLGIPNENDAKAVDVRQELDLKVMNAVFWSLAISSH